MASSARSTATAFVASAAGRRSNIIGNPGQASKISRISEIRAIHSRLGESSAVGADCGLKFGRQWRGISNSGIITADNNDWSDNKMMRRDYEEEYEEEYEEDYKSPFESFFNTIASGRTTVGTESDSRFIPPPKRFTKSGIPEDALSFRTVGYGRFHLPPYISPGEHRVTMKVDVAAIPFDSQTQRDVFFQIVGPRFSAKRNELKLSSLQFASRIENKRHLVSMLDRIFLASKRLAGKDGGDDGKSTTTTQA